MADPPLRPVAAGDRIESLDVLRGFALLGILLMNIQSFAMVSAAYVNPTAFGDLSGANYWVWYLTRLFVDQKFMTIFSALFGAGIVLMWQRAEAAGRAMTGLHYRRTFWLIVFGLVHAYLLWSGDILFLYGICALWVYWFRRLRPKTLLVVAAVLLQLSPALMAFAGFSMPYWSPEQIEQFEREMMPGDDAKAEEVANFQGGWRRQMNSRVPLTIGFHTGAFIFWGIWRAGGLMLVGMALFKLGFFSAEWTATSYRRLAIVGPVLGLPLIAYGVMVDFAAGWGVSRFFLGFNYNYYGSLAVSLGWASAVLLLCKRGAFESLQRGLSAVGRMALSNYLLQTIICTTIFYGHGLGYFGQVDRVGQLLVVFGVWAFQVPFSIWWLERFRFGPFEWLWRTLSYLRLQPMRRAPLAMSEGAG